MKCYVHRSDDAVGLCKTCQKGLCEKCAVDLGHALVCRGACETEAALIHAQILTSRRLLAVQRWTRYIAPVFFVALGLMFLIADARSPRFSWFETGSGVLFVLFGAVILVANRRWLKNSDKDAQK